MRLSTAHLAHLIVPPSEQRARHREFHRRMWAPDHNESSAGTLAPQDRGGRLAHTAIGIDLSVAGSSRLAQIEPEARRPPIRDTDEECLRWMRAEFLRKRFAQPYLRPVLIARSVGARAFGVTIREMISDDRRWPLVHYRGKTMAFTKVVTGASTTEIGRVFGRDHTTICHAFKRFGDLVRRALSEVQG